MRRDQDNAPAMPHTSGGGIHRIFRKAQTLRSRAAWWFQQMRRTVDEADDFTPAPERAEQLEISGDPCVEHSMPVSGQEYCKGANINAGGVQIPTEATSATSPDGTSPAPTEKQP
jgi:hypothetical protein